MRTSMPSRPNILFIMVDQMRYPPAYPGADPMEPLYQILRFQDTDLATNPYAALFPGFCMLRQHGVSLQNHTASSMACVPSRASIFTGQYSARSGVTQTEGMFKVDTDPAFPWLPQDGVPTLGDWFRAAGYETHYFGRWDLSNPPVGSLEPWGFSSWEASYPSDQRFGSPNLGVYRDKGYTPLVEAFLKRKALGTQSNIINSNNPTNASFKQSPWLAVASFVNPHDIGGYPVPWKPNVQPLDAAALGTGANNPLRPYGAPPAGTRSNPPPYPNNTSGTWRVPLNPQGFNASGLLLPPTLNEDLARGKPTCQADYAYKFQIALTTLRGQNALKASPYPFQMQQNAGDWYRAYLEFYLYLQYLVNLEISAVVSCLHETGLAENTIVVFTSDHGELGGAHGGQIEKWHNAYQESIHVPAIVSGPRVNPRGPLKFVQGHSTHVDWIPTLLGLAGYSASDQAALGGFIQGHTVEPLAGRDLSATLMDPARPTSGGVLFVSDDHITAPLDTSYLPQRYGWYLDWTRQFWAADGVPTAAQPLQAPGPVVQPNHLQSYFELPWKLTRYWDPGDASRTQWELYNLAADPLENRNLLGWQDGRPVLLDAVVDALGLGREQTRRALAHMRLKLNDALAEAGYSRESAEQLGYVADGLTLLEKQQLG
jgi:arylsulfatase A-like enzyme